MGIAGSIVVFIVIWWLVLFMALPIGVRRDEAPEDGHDPGAPRNPNLGKKIIGTTIVSIVLFGIVYWVIDSGLISIVPPPPDGQ